MSRRRPRGRRRSHTSWRARWAKLSSGVGRPRWKARAGMRAIACGSPTRTPACTCLHGCPTTITRKSTSWVRHAHKRGLYPVAPCYHRKPAVPGPMLGYCGLAEAESREATRLFGTRLDDIDSKVQNRRGDATRGAGINARECVNEIRHVSGAGVDHATTIERSHCNDFTETQHGVHDRLAVSFPT